jgi:CBS domain-containing protein
MGEHKVNTKIDEQLRSTFIKHLVDDIEALEIMIEKGMIEDNIIRIGAEQEFCLLNENWRPAINSLEVLEQVNDDHFTTELARYNLEINLDPFKLEKDCFSKVEEQLTNLLDKAKTEADKLYTNTLLTGILPTISKSQLRFDYMTPNPRYWALNDMMKAERGGDFELHLTGVDELAVRHDSVLFEACNTSFQIHLQIEPDDFVSSYNWAQAISGPVLGICCNSPLLLGRELWSETRIALFQQSIDTRNSSYALKDKQARVSFGEDWAQGTIADIYKNNIASFDIIITKEIEKSSLDVLNEGGIPKLPALNLHNGTVYQWNRACYGVGGGKPHFRIENRYIPSGPTVIDEMANFAFWVGLMKGRPERYDDLPKVMDFREAKANFIKAARTGKESEMSWKGESWSVRDLVIKELIPIARTGLEKMNIDEADINRLLGVIRKRADGNTGAQWIIRNYRALKKKLKQDDALVQLVQEIHNNQQHNVPVHDWPDVIPAEQPNRAATKVEHVMSTQIFTVKENDSAELATHIMKWKNIHHVPVENKVGEICGILTWTHMKRFLGDKDHKDLLVREIMEKDFIAVEPNMDIKAAIHIMKSNEIGCLPIVHDKHVIGLVTIPDVIEFDNA